jgi:phage gpG-like protein
MPNLNVDIELNRELKVLMQRMGDLRPTQRRFLTTAGIQVQGISRRKFLSGPRPKKLAPVTGRLRRSVTVSKVGLPDFVDVGTPLIYGPPHEFGATIRARRAKMLAFRVGPKAHLGRGEFVQVKQVKLPPRPFLAPAFAIVRPKLSKLMVKQLRKDLKL